MLPFTRSRAGARRKYERKLGAPAGVAALAAIALHPFVRSSPKPMSGEFTKLVRAQSSEFARRARGVKTADELLKTARPVVEHWHLAACAYGEGHDAGELAELLDLTAAQGEPRSRTLGHQVHDVEVFEDDILDRASGDR